MLPPLTPQQTQWVETTLSKLSLEESLAQLLCVSQGESSQAYWLRLIEKTPIGRLLFVPASVGRVAKRIETQQRPGGMVAFRLGSTQAASGSKFSHPSGTEILSSKLLNL